MRFLKAFLASVSGLRSPTAGETAPSQEEMGNTIIPLGKSSERRGVMLEFENLKMTNLLNW
ncbi:MAG: hypothetical protein KME55_06200 [Nostoc indistinguendum CM1-VF10]|nr:hypothetical protein [Nostoc indistinguendum CM1-VF10]